MRLEDIYLTEDNKTLEQISAQISDAAEELGGWNGEKVPAGLQKKISELMTDARELADRDTSYGGNRPKKGEINSLKKRANAIEAQLDKLHK